MQDTDNLLAIGQEDQNGAFIIEDNKRNAKAEEAIRLIYDGKSTKEAAKAVGLTPDEFKGILGRNTDYSLIHARAKLSKYCDLVEELMEFVEKLPPIVTRDEQYTLDKKYDAMKFTIGQYGQHVAKAVEQAGLTLNIPAGASTSGIQITFTGTDTTSPANSTDEMKEADVIDT